MTPDSFYTQHSPFGAFASFTVGLLDGRGGFGESLAGPADQNVFVGYRGLRQPRWQLLPYFQRQPSQESAFLGISNRLEGGAGLEKIAPDAFQRELGWASDTWQADEGRFRFSLLTPFERVPEPTTLSRAAARRFLAPLVCGWIEYDNRAGRDDVELMFGLGDTTRSPHALEVKGLAGFAHGTAHGFATKSVPGVELRQSFELFPVKYRDYRGLHQLGGEAALVFRVPAGRKRRFPLVLGFFNGAQITTGIDATFLYARYFENLPDVLAHGLREFAWYEKTAAARDHELRASRLNADQQFLVAQATHSYLGNTQLLEHRGKPLWVVNEGEYRMMNTFDLTVDHLFHELAWHPWTVRNTLDLFVARYAFTDRIKVDGRRVAGGLSFAHDMGVVNQFSPAGHSSYECDNLPGCFSHMTMEQLLNWVLCAVCYADNTGHLAWLRRNRKSLDACVESMLRRDHPDPKQRDGILKFDSDRCGTGSEITTYDSLDVSLGQARNNLYLAVKTLGAWILLEHAYGRLRAPRHKEVAATAADRLAATLASKVEADTGFFPAVFEHGNTSRIIPAIEGFAYPLYLGLKAATDRHGRFGPLLCLLERHIQQALQPGVCLDATSGAWKMSSTSINTWFSKIALSQYVVRQLFPEALNAAARRGDKVHADWQRQPGCGFRAMCDQIRSDTGEALGSKYYPRGVTTALWLLERRKR